MDMEGPDGTSGMEGSEEVEEEGIISIEDHRCWSAESCCGLPDGKGSRNTCSWRELNSASANLLSPPFSPPFHERLGPSPGYGPPCHPPNETRCPVPATPPPGAQLFDRAARPPSPPSARLRPPCCEAKTPPSVRPAPPPDDADRGLLAGAAAYFEAGM